MLTATVTGEPTDRPALLIAHGLFGSARNWGAIARRLGEGREVVAVDMRNHGESFRAGSQGYGDMAGDLAEVIAARGGRMDVLGHSMGGKAAMRLALAHPESINRLIVADISPVAYDHSQGHLVEAMAALDLDGVSQRSEADRRLAGAVEEPEVRAFLLQSLDLKADPPRWRLNLEVLGREMARIVGWEEVPGRFDGPSLFLSGQLSSYVSPGHREKILAQFPSAVFAKIPGTGHWLHAEKPREFAAAVAAFLDAGA